MPTRETSNQELRQATRDLIIECNLPIRMVDSAAFQKLIRLTRVPGAVNRDIIGKEITNTYLNRKVEILSTLSYHVDHGIKFALCVDCWTSKSQHAFLGVSIHYINKQWQQESFLLALADLRRRHKGVYLYKTLNKVLQTFGISQSILAVIRDNASNNKTLMEAFQEEYSRQRANRGIYSIPCADHVLNLVCQAIMKKLNATTDELEIQDLTAETYLVDNKEAESEARDREIGYSQPKRRRLSRKQTKRRTKVAPEGLNTWSKIRWITGKLRQQQHLIRSLERNITQIMTDKPGIKMNRPTLDVPTRWNSFYYMLRNFSQSRPAIEAVIRRYPRDFQNLELLEADWSDIGEIQNTLGRIEVLSSFFQGSRAYPTLSSVLLMIGQLYLDLNELIETDELKPAIKQAYITGLEKLKKYFPPEPDLSDRVTQAHVITTILDPRFKLQGLRGPQWTPERLDRAKRRIKSKYSYYEQ